mmetsp:Transcript_36337/g.67615  ORF Transcript_36337/g.67615 Transcript_36337/m.67615 type:complete len:418 (+) Transcript_36337:30-1283(+)
MPRDATAWRARHRLHRQPLAKGCASRKLGLVFALGCLGLEGESFRRQLADGLCAADAVTETGRRAFAGADSEESSKASALYASRATPANVAEDVDMGRPQESPTRLPGPEAPSRSFPERHRELRTPLVIEDIIAGALVGAVTGAVAGAGSGAALGGAGGSGLAGSAAGAASGAALGLTSGAMTGAALITVNPDVAAAGVAAAGVGAAAGVAAMLNRVQVAPQDQYDHWPSSRLVSPSPFDGAALAPREPRDPLPRPSELLPQGTDSLQTRPFEEARAPQTSPPAAPAAPPRIPAPAEGSSPVAERGDSPPRAEDISSGARTEDPPVVPPQAAMSAMQPHKRWKRASLRRANSMLSSEIEARSGEVVAKGLDTLGVLLSKLRRLQAVSEAAIAQATEQTVQRARSLGSKERAEAEETD